MAAAGIESVVKQGERASITSWYSLIQLVCSGQRFAASLRRLSLVRPSMLGGAQKDHLAVTCMSQHQSWGG